MKMRPNWSLHVTGVSGILTDLMSNDLGRQNVSLVLNSSSPTPWNQWHLFVPSAILLMKNALGRESQYHPG